MCEQCGCFPLIEQGRKAVLDRAVAIIEKMGVSAENVQRFEDGERICGLVASKLADGEDEEVRQVAEWVRGLHKRNYAERSEAYVAAARDVFARFPAKGSPRDVITTWHQLEQLCRELSEEDISSIEDSATRDAIRAVTHVHDDLQQRRVDFARRYHLED
ncbi:MAG: hypothetical protein HYY46_10495 [Deltaproteobacteria bacterium]|nr:hypothetical protein [Deltaproteobacteria bacterium]